VALSGVQLGFKGKSFSNQRFSKFQTFIPEGITPNGLLPTGAIK
jgi:hypothetical protein